MQFYFGKKNSVILPSCRQNWQKHLNLEIFPYYGTWYLWFVSYLLYIKYYTFYIYLCFQSFSCYHNRQPDTWKNISWKPIKYFLKFYLWFLNLLLFMFIELNLYIFSKVSLPGWLRKYWQTGIPLNITQTDHVLKQMECGMIVYHDKEIGSLKTWCKDILLAFSASSHLFILKLQSFLNHDTFLPLHKIGLLMWIILRTSCRYLQPRRNHRTNCHVRKYYFYDAQKNMNFNERIW